MPNTLKILKVHMETDWGRVQNGECDVNACYGEPKWIFFVGVGGLFLYHFCFLLTTNLAIPTAVFCWKFQSALRNACNTSEALLASHWR